MCGTLFGAMFWRSLLNDDVKFHIWGSDDNGSSQKWIFHSLPSQENHSYQARESAVRLFCTTWSTWNIRKRRNWTQSSILMWRFRCSCRRSFLNSLSKLPNTLTTEYGSTPAYRACSTGSSTVIVLDTDYILRRSSCVFFCMSFQKGGWTLVRSLADMIIDEGLLNTRNSSVDVDRDSSPLTQIHHFTVACLVAWPLNESEAGGDIVLIETFLLFLW